MRTTITVIKADVGSIGGHTLPSVELLEIVREHVKDAHRRATTSRLR
jgi:fructose 1,6-bisphosphatase